MKRMLLVLWIGALAVPALVTTITARAGVGHGHGCRESRCPTCDKICHAEIVPTKEKKTTWDVECEDICIPAITFPWQKCCQPRCGKVITVNRLKKIEYECESCGCKWSIESLPCECGHGHGGCLGESCSVGLDSHAPNLGDAKSGAARTESAAPHTRVVPRVEIATPDVYRPANGQRRNSSPADYFRLGPPLPTASE